MPTPEQFRNELVSFQAQLAMPSKAQKIVDRSGGVLNALNFAKPGVKMNFGISHNQKNSAIKNDEDVTALQAIKKTS